MEEIVFQEGDIKSFEKLLRTHYDQPIKHYTVELTKIRTGRVATALIEGLKVETYGQLMALKELATLAAPDSRLLTIQPWDANTIDAIEKAITTSDLGVTPSNDGSIIRLQFPQMSAERRDDLIKQLGKKTEECRVNIRNVRKDVHNEIRDANKKKIISEDFAHKLSETMQKITDEFIKKADDLQTKKENELKSI